MTQEEKAKAYDEALERAKTIIDGKDGWNFADHIEIDPVIKEIFPQLRESEDERIRKELLDFVRSFWADHKEKLPQVSKWVTYLEKQKEIPIPNSTELIEMWHKEEAMLKEKDFHGDTWRIAYNAFLDGFAQGMMVKQKKPKNTSASVMAPSCWEVEQKEQKPADDMAFEKWLDDWYQGSKEISGYVVMSKAEFKNWSRGIKNMYQQKLDIALIQRSWYMEGYHDREFGMEPLWIIKTGEDGPKHELNPKYGQSLADEQKPAWKPSEEQMKALEGEIRYCYACGMHDRGRELQSLYEQLKKLM